MAQDLIAGLERGPRRHAGIMRRQQTVAVDELVLERGGHVQHDDGGQGVGQPAVQRLDRFRQLAVGADEVRQRQHAEKHDRESRRRAVRPAGQRHGKEEQIQDAVGGPRGAALPLRHGRIGGAR